MVRFGFQTNIIILHSSSSYSRQTRNGHSVATGTEGVRGGGEEGDKDGGEKDGGAKDGGAKEGESLSNLYRTVFFRAHLCMKLLRQSPLPSLHKLSDYHKALPSFGRALAA